MFAIWMSSLFYTVLIVFGCCNLSCKSRTTVAGEVLALVGLK